MDMGPGPGPRAQKLRALRPRPSSFISLPCFLRRRCPFSVVVDQEEDVRFLLLWNKKMSGFYCCGTRRRCPVSIVVEQEEQNRQNKYATLCSRFCLFNIRIIVVQTVVLIPVVQTVMLIPVLQIGRDPTVHVFLAMKLTAWNIILPP